jgi:hypothetical protein
MIKTIAAAFIGIAIMTPVMAQQKTSTNPVLIADGGRAYTGKSSQSSASQPSSPTSQKSPSPTSSAQPKPAADPVGTAVQTGKDVLGIFR